MAQCVRQNKDYVHLDYTRRVYEVFAELLKKLQQAGWTRTEHVTLHQSVAEGHAGQHREWMRASFHTPVLAQALYYVAKDMQVVIRLTSYTLELWNSSFNAETNSKAR